MRSLSMLSGKVDHLKGVLGNRKRTYDALPALLIMGAWSRGMIFASQLLKGLDCERSWVQFPQRPGFFLAVSYTIS